MLGFSIIVCSYNPNERALARLLRRLAQLDVDRTIAWEVILVDNNSRIPLAERDPVREWMNTCPTARCVVEYEPGLTAARLRGIKESAFPWLILIDDDNEPAADYLTRAAQFIESAEAASVGAFGPGTIAVEYLDPVEPWLHEVKELFQERAVERSVFSQQRAWQLYYPVGTGMVIRKELAELYADRVINGSYTLSDRKGKSLSSGGDVQMVFTAIQQGYQVGVVAGLSMAHLIAGDKANLRYLKKQQYGTASAYTKAYNQVYTDATIPTHLITNRQILLKMYALFRHSYRRLARPQFTLLMCSKMGEFKAVLEAHPQPTPWLLRIVEKWIHG